MSGFEGRQRRREELRLQVSGRRKRAKRAGASQHSSLGSHQLCAPLMAFILVAFEATHPRSLVTTAAHFSILHVLTDVRS